MAMDGADLSKLLHDSTIHRDDKEYSASKGRTEQYELIFQHARSFDGVEDSEYLNIGALQSRCDDAFWPRVSEQFVRETLLSHENQ